MAKQFFSSTQPLQVGVEPLLINTSDIIRRIGRVAGANLLGVAPGLKGPDADDNNRRRGLTMIQVLLGRDKSLFDIRLGLSS